MAAYEVNLGYAAVGPNRHFEDHVSAHVGRPSQLRSVEQRALCWAQGRKNIVSPFSAAAK